MWNPGSARSPEDLFEARSVAAATRRLAGLVVDRLTGGVEKGKRRDGAAIEARNERLLFAGRMIQVHDEEPDRVLLPTGQRDEALRLAVGVPAVRRPEEDRGRRSEERRVGKECRSRWSP